MEQLKKAALRTAFRYLEKNPEENAPKLLAWVDRLAGDGPDSFPTQRAAFHQVLDHPENPMYQLLMRILRETDSGVLKAAFENFILNANLVGWPRQEAFRKQYDCNIPWAILLDPTSACNLRCTGCWAAEYGNRLNLTLEEMDSLIRQGKDLGIYMYIFTGGEPLVRRKDLMALCRMHPDCQFLCFTNGTLIDENFGEELLQVRNFIPAISLEGFEEATDARRGPGTYRKVLRAMEVLRNRQLPFGLSSCYTSQNLSSIASYEFVDQAIRWGASFLWYFHYMPVGNDAVPELLPTPSQREFMYRRVRKLRQTRPIFAMDFQNDGEYVGGCIAGGRRYLHINANGDADPCVFIHYSNANIRDHTLLECLQSPIFQAYRKGQPFSDNHLRPCPMLENPELLRQMVRETGAHSTDLQSPEEVDHLCGACLSYAQSWKPVAEKLWREKKD